MSLKYIRNVAFWSFLILYFIITPLISLHALGFVIDPKTFRMVKTGIISVTTEPRNSVISVDGKLYARKTPVAVAGLLAGNYRVKIEAPHYLSIETSVDVLVEEVTRMDHVLLIRDQLTPQAPVSIPAQLMIQPDGSRYLFLVSHLSGNLTVNALDLRKKKLMPILAYGEEQVGRAEFIQISVSEDEKKALICLKGNLKSECWVSGLTNQSDVIQISNLISELISNVRFNPKNSKELFYISGDDLILADLDSVSKKKLVVKHVVNFEVVDDAIYFFTNDSQLFSCNLQGREIQNLLPDRGLYKLLFGENKSASYQLFLTGRQSAFWLREDGILLTNRLPHFIDEGVRGAQLFQDSEKLLYWKSNELWLIDMEMFADRERSFFERGPEKKLLLSTKRPIVSAQMFRGGYQVIAATNDELILLQTELNLSEAPAALMKHKVKDNISFFVDEMSGDLYWIDSVPDKLFQLQRSALFEGSIFPFSFRFKKPFSSPKEVAL